MTAARRFLALALAAALVPALAAARPAIRPTSRMQLDASRRMDARGVSFVHSNFGVLASDLIGGLPHGLLFPRGTLNGVLYGSGLWLGGKVAGDLRLAIAEYSSEYQPGAMIGPVPDLPSRPEYVVWKVHAPGAPADTAHLARTPAELAADPSLDPLAHHGWAEYVANAAPYGAPTRVWRLANTSTPDPSDSVDVIGPAVEGTLSTWCVYNDADPSSHIGHAGGTAPLGVQVSQTVRVVPAGWASPDNAVLVRFQIVNRSGEWIDSLRVGLWADPDLGEPGDDLVGWDSATQMGYAYNATNADAMYGTTPPAVGAMFLTAPGTAQPTAQSFVHYINGTDPRSSFQSWNYLNGFMPDGGPLLDPTTGLPTKFELSGDPILGTGWTDSNPADRRFMLTQEFGTLAPGAGVDVTVAYLVAPGTDRLASLNQLRCMADYLRDAWASQFALPAPPLPACPTVADCPRRPDWWAAQCTGDVYAPDTLALLASRVNDWSQALNWSSPRDGFCSAVSLSGDVRQQVEGIYAALLANVLAGRLGLQPHDGNPVRLTNAVNATCYAVQATTLDELLEPASVLSPVPLGRYLDDSHVHVGPGLAGVGAGLTGFNGGAGAAYDFFGGIDPYTHPDSFPTVRLTFDRAHPRNAYRYLRLETTTGTAPSTGRGYRFAGYVPTFVTATDVQTGAPLSVAFVERVVSDADGTILGPEYQYATFDSTWLPGNIDLGGREYLFVSKQPWSAAPDPMFTLDGAVLDGSARWLYTLWSQRTAFDPAVIDDGDGFQFEIGVPDGPGVDQALVALALRPLSDPAVLGRYSDLAYCLSSLNNGDRSTSACDAPTPVLASLVSAFAEPGLVRVEWSVAMSGLVTVERRDADGAWLAVTILAPDGAGRVVWEDRDVAAGRTYAYRLRLGDATMADVSVTVPGGFRLALAGLRPNPATSASSLAFSLATREAATVELLDVAGRRVWSRTLRAPEPGAQVLPLGEAHLAPGVYLVRLAQGRERASAKAVIVR